MLVDLDVPRALQLVAGEPGARDLAEVRPGGGEVLDDVLAAVADPQGAVQRVDGDGAGELELPVGGALGSPHRLYGPVRVHHHDAEVVAVGDIDRAVRSDRHPMGVVEEPRFGAEAVVVTGGNPRECAGTSVDLVHARGLS